MDVAKRAIRNLPPWSKICDYYSCGMLAPWALPDHLADEIDYASFRCLLRACFQHLKRSDREVPCEYCADTGHPSYQPYQEGLCYNCRPSGAQTAAVLSCDWEKVAESFTFDGLTAPNLRANDGFSF